MTISSPNIQPAQDTELLLKSHFEDLHEYEEVKNAHHEFVLSEQKGIPFEDVFKNVE